MSWNNFLIGVCVAATFIVGAVALAVPNLSERIRILYASDRCDSRYAEEGAKIDCWLQMPLEFVKAGSMKAGFRAFSYLYDTYPLFASSGCHRHAHKIGDAAYSGFYVGRGLALEEIDFPQEATACGYGFFHGFIEHLVQNNADKQFVVSSCEYLRATYSSTMRDVGTICYHASGHGFMQREADSLPKGMWGNAANMVAQPLKRCEELPTNEREIEDCREGVFNVLVDWMETGNFGLAPRKQDPLVLCGQVEEGWRYACLYELAQNLGNITEGSPLKAAAFAASIRDTEQRKMAFGVMVAGMMQSATALDEYKRILAECNSIKEAALYETCVVSSANGMMEHGEPGEEYKKVLDLCADPSLREGGDAACYLALSKRLPRFYEPGKAARICAAFPEIYRQSCDEARFPKDGIL